jgi:hypothetical protein
MKRSFFLTSAVCALATFACLPESHADWIRSFTGVDSVRSAEVRFTYEASTGKLIVDLTNTDPHSSVVAGPGNNLTAVFFSADFVLNAASGTAYVPTIGSLIQADDLGNITPWTTWPYVAPPERSVGTEWAYKSGLVGAPGGGTQGLSSAGLDLFVPEDRFETSYDKEILAWPASVDGENCGLVPAGTTTVVASLTGQLLIRNSATFTFTGVGDLSGKADSINKVAFLYGTAVDGPSIVGVPEPSTFILLGTSVLGLLAYGWRCRLGGAPFLGSRSR